MADLASFGPDVRAAAGLAELDRLLNDSQLGVDLQRAGLHAQRAGL
jgi:hypothetical protein